MTDTRSYEDLSTNPPELQARPSDLVADDLPEVDLDERSEQPDDQQLLEDIEEALKDVVDPELGINVVDLGLIYGLHLEDDDSLTIDMTLTSAACPLTDVIEDQTQTALEGLIDQLYAALEDAHYFHPPDRTPATKNTLRTILTKAGWSAREIQALRGVSRTLVEPGGRPRT